MNCLEEKRKALMGEIDYGLPKGYMAVAYLESTSMKQWFDSGIKASNKVNIQGEFYVDRTTISDTYVILWGGENSINNKSTSLLRNKDGSWTFCSGLYRSNFDQPSDEKLHFTVSTTVTKCIINGVTRDTVNSTSFTSTKNIFIFGTSSTTRIRPDKGDDGLKRIYWMKMWENGNLVRDFQPCLDASSTPCLYDRVSKQTFYNKGSLNLGYKLL